MTDIQTGHSIVVGKIPDGNVVIPAEINFLAPSLKLPIDNEPVPADADPPVLIPFLHGPDAVHRLVRLLFVEYNAGPVLALHGDVRLDQMQLRLTEIIAAAFPFRFRKRSGLFLRPFQKIFLLSEKIIQPFLTRAGIFIGK